EVEVARGTLLIRRKHPDDALSCGLVALGIVLEILGDGTPQVAECLTLVALALRLKNKPVAAAAVIRQAHAVRVYAAMVAAAAYDATTAAAVIRPRPTQAAVLESLADAASSQLPLAPRKHAPAEAPAEAATESAAGVAAASASADVGERPTVHSGADGSENSQKRPRSSPRTRGTPRPTRSLGGSALLHRSPIVQVPLPDGMEPDGGDTAGSPRSTPPRSPSSLLNPSPLLVLLSPEDGDDSVNARVTGGSPRCLSDSPGWPSVQRIFSSRMVAANAATAAGGSSLVHHVSYPPPLAPVDSA
ncbi:hypothetical protein Vretifemale_13650, partial [Volvox reticuliferus]